mmetsp:Transcript_30222/g.34700  ORF Transcript_30222/g.34700 Transcript_30222/m.34700 type:complete len:173 (-) Transcript_30222:108-626(-)
MYSTEDDGCGTNCTVQRVCDPSLDLRTVYLCQRLYDCINTFVAWRGVAASTQQLCQEYILSSSACLRVCCVVVPLLHATKYPSCAAAHPQADRPPSALLPHSDHLIGPCRTVHDPFKFGEMRAQWWVEVMAVAVAVQVVYTRGSSSCSFRHILSFSPTTLLPSATPQGMTGD